MKPYSANSKDELKTTLERRFEKRQTAAKWMIATFVILCIISTTVVAAEPDFCRITAKTVFESCEDSAESNSKLDLATCENVSDPAQREACRDRAVKDFHEALALCEDELKARQAACDRLGPARYDPVIDPSRFVTKIDNPYFPLRPGTTFIYEGQTEDGLEHDEFFVTHQTRVISGVTCVEVRDTVRLNGKLAEDTLDWFAQDKDGNVWYFGENTHEVAHGLITTIAGSFRAGVDGAKPGIVMKAHPMVGDFYRQEFSLANAEDYAEVVSLDKSVTVPAGSFGHCLKTRETTPLEPELLEYKFYTPGVGNVLEVDAETGDRIELVQIKTD